MDLKFDYDTYQGVRHNLFLYSTPVLLIAGFFTYFFVLPPALQQATVQALEYIANTEPLKGIVGTTAGFVVFVGIAFILTEIIQVHDQWYDKYVIRWRHRYATDFILPRLLQPWACHMNYRLFEAADTYVRQFQERLYYPFVGDRDLKIPKNKLVRFYEVITIYWLTQINEIVLLIISAIIIIFRFLGPLDLAYRTVLFNSLAIVIAAFLLNRAWARASLNKVRRATEEEIWAIIEDPDLKGDLEGRLKKLCEDYSIPYDEAS